MTCGKDVSAAFSWACFYEVKFSCSRFYIQNFQDCGVEIYESRCFGPSHPFLFYLFLHSSQWLIFKYPIYSQNSQQAINLRGLWVGGLLVWHVASLWHWSRVRLRTSHDHMRRTLFIIGGSILVAAGKSAAVNLSSSQNVNVPL